MDMIITQLYYVTNKQEREREGETAIRTYEATDATTQRPGTGAGMRRLINALITD